MKFRFVSLCGAALLLLSGCAGLPVETIDVYQMQQLRHWYTQKNWQFEGRLGVVAEHDSFSANIAWRHEPGSDVIDMAGPLGLGRMQFVVTDKDVVVDDGEHVVVYQQDAGRIMAQYFGVDLPVRAFQYWVLGLVEPDVDYMEYERGFAQHGWRVVYRQMQGIDGDWLPRRINMEKDKTRVKLIVDQWKLS